MNKESILQDIRSGRLKRNYFTQAARPCMQNFGFTFRYIYPDQPNEYLISIEANPYVTTYSETGYSVYYNTVKASESPIRNSVFDSIINEAITKSDFDMCFDLYELEKQTPRCDYSLA